MRSRKIVEKIWNLFCLVSWGAIMVAIASYLTACGPDLIVVQGQPGPQGSPGIDGRDGIDGADAVLPPYTVTEIIDPCGDVPNVYDEVLLKLANGQILASFSQNGSALTTRFSLIPAGTYQTTDGTGCVFSVSSSGVVSW